jgi:nucleoside-diphosphate-sugar epimerase
MARALVTGGTGFLGANLAARLVADGHDVHLLARPASDPWRLTALRSQIQLHEADVRDGAAVQRVCGLVRPTWVFHLAAHGNSSWETGTREIIDVTLVGAVNVFDAATRVDCEAIVHAGSSSEYGFSTGPTVETDRLAPNSTYAVAKAAATLHGQQRARAHGDPIVTLRFYSVYGSWEEPARLLPALIVRGLRGEWPPLVHPSIARDFVHVDDAVDACVVAARAASAQRGEVFNVGSGVQTTIGDVVALAQRVLPIRGEPPWERMPARTWDTTTWLADIRLIAGTLGWHPTIPFDQGFRRFVAWFEEDPTRQEIYRTRSGGRT